MATGDFQYFCSICNKVYYYMSSCPTHGLPKLTWNDVYYPQWPSGRSIKEEDEKNMSMDSFLGNRLGGPGRCKLCAAYVGNVSYHESVCGKPITSIEVNRITNEVKNLNCNKAHKVSKCGHCDSNKLKQELKATRALLDIERKDNERLTNKLIEIKAETLRLTCVSYDYDPTPRGEERLANIRKIING